MKNPSPRSCPVVSIVAFLCIFGVLAVIYFPVVFTDYFYHDDCQLFLEKHWEHPSLAHQMSMGRFLGYYIFNLTGVRHISDLSMIRLLSVVNIGICAFLIFLLIQRHFQRPLGALLFALINVTLPGFEVMVSWASAVCISFALIVASFAAMTANKIPVVRPWWKVYTRPRAVLSIFLLLCAISIHQSLAVLENSVQRITFSV